MAKFPAFVLITSGAVVWRAVESGNLASLFALPVVLFIGAAYCKA